MDPVISLCPDLYDLKHSNSLYIVSFPVIPSPTLCYSLLTFGKRSILHYRYSCRKQPVSAFCWALSRCKRRHGSCSRKPSDRHSLCWGLKTRFTRFRSMIRLFIIIIFLYFSPDLTSTNNFFTRYNCVIALI